MKKQILVLCFLLVGCGRWAPEIKTSVEGETSHRVETESEVTVDVETAIDKILEICAVEGKRFSAWNSDQRECVEVLLRGLL